MISISTLILAAYGALGLLAFLIIWLAFDAEFITALILAVLGTAGLAFLVSTLANAGRLF